MDVQTSLTNNEELPINLVKVKMDVSSMLNEKPSVREFSENSEDDEDYIKMEMASDDDDDDNSKDEGNNDDETDQIESTKRENISKNTGIDENEDRDDMSNDSLNTSDGEGDGNVNQAIKSEDIYRENCIAMQAKLFGKNSTRNPDTQSSFLNMPMGMLMGPEQFALLNTFPMNFMSVDNLTQSNSMSTSKPKKPRKAQIFPCKVCGRNFTRNHSLKRHVRKIHNNAGEDGEVVDINDDDVQTSGTFTGLSERAGIGPLGLQGDSLWVDEVLEGSDGFSCKFCGKAFTQRLSLKRHIRRLHGKRPWTCGVCEMQFCEVGLLERHMRTHSGERPFECTICTATFSKLGNLQRHEKIHTGVKPFDCDICNKAFQSLQELKRHARTHTNERPFSCSICEKTFSESCHLQRHMITHTGFKPFQCKLCDKYFSQYDNLKQHMTTHTGERPHKCPECDKAFARQADVRKHIRVHTGERPFKCSECEKSFSVSSTLHKHMLTHTGEKRFSCEICDRSFALNCNLKKHVRTHFKPKTFMCGVCQADFDVEEELQEHIVSAHNYGNDDGLIGQKEEKANEEDDAVVSPNTGSHHVSGDEGSDESMKKDISESQNSGNNENQVSSD